MVGAAFAFGREHVIPEMFRALLVKLAVDETSAPAFHYYLKRHIDLDGDIHAPLAMEMVDELINGSKLRLHEAEQAAVEAVEARITFWDGVQEAIEQGNRQAHLKTA